MKNHGALGWPGRLSIWLLVLAQVMISQFVRSSPYAGLCADNVEPAWDSLPLCVTPLLSLKKKKNNNKGRLGGTVGWVTNFGSGHDLIVYGFEPLVHLCADSSEPASDSVSPSLFVPPLLTRGLSLKYK